MRLLFACVLIAACGHGRPTALGFSHEDLGHCGPIASVRVELSRNCDVTVKDASQHVRTLALARAECDALFDQARHAQLAAHPDCPVAQQFISGASVTFADGAERFACSGEPFANRLLGLAERIAPNWKQTPPPESNGCDFSKDKIEGVLVKPR